MKTACLLSCLLIFLHITAFGRDTQIGLGMPSVSINDRSYPSSSSLYNKWLTDNSEIYNLRLHTKRSGSCSLPIIYFSTFIVDRVVFRSSVSFQRETLIYSFNPFVISEENPITDNYKGQFTQLAITTGMSYFIRKKKNNNLYISADLVHTIKHIYETGYYEPTRMNPNQSGEEVRLYYIGFNPSLGFTQRICKSVSCTVESGAEVNFSANKRFSPLLFWKPLNRLSLNYNF